MKTKYLFLVFLIQFISIPLKAYIIDGIGYEIDEYDNTAYVTYNNTYVDENDDLHADPTYSGIIVIKSEITYWDKQTYPVTSIGWDAFIGSGITSVTIPNSINYIYPRAFEDCNNLTSVIVKNETPISISSHTFPNRANITLYVPADSKAAYESANYWKEFKEIVGFITFEDSNVEAICLANWDTNGDGILTFSEAAAVTTIGNVFENNTSITSFDELQYFTSVTSLANSAFAGCSALTSIVLPNGLTSIGNEAFDSCSELASIIIPDGVTAINYATFWHCYKLATVNIPNGVTTIGNWAFYRCSISSLTIPESVTSISNSAFAGCSSLTSIEVEGGNTIYDSRNDCNAIIETATNTLLAGCANTTIPESVTSIGDNAFYERSTITSITIPDAITSIGERAFIGCSNLTSIIIPEGVTSLGYASFNECSSLTTVIIPGNVTSIGERAFSACNSLASVIVNIETPLTIDEYCFSTVSGYSYGKTNATLYVHKGCKSAYEAALYWQDFKEIIEIPTVNVGSTGFATFCSPVDMDFSSVTEIKAYIASGFNPSTGTLVLTRVTEVPAGEGLYIVGDEGSYNVPATTTDMVYSNLLKGVTTATTISPTDGDNTNFILANGSHGVGFYTLSAAGELAGGKAYLQLQTASVASVKAINVVFNDEETAIKDVEQSPNVQGIYNLQGQQVNAPRRGLYIINGKKVIIK